MPWIVKRDDDDAKAGEEEEVRPHLPNGISGHDLRRTENDFERDQVDIVLNDKFNRAYADYTR